MNMFRTLLLTMALVCLVRIGVSQPAYWMRLVDGLELCEIQTADENMLVLSFRSEQLENDYAVAPSMKVQDYSINGVNPVQVGRYSSTMFRYHNIYRNPDTGFWFEPDERYMPEMVLHKMYLKLKDPLSEGTNYTISFPTGDTTFTFRKKQTICESIKVNQVGYNHRSAQRKAFLRVWAGDLGGLAYTGPKEFEIYNAMNHTLVYSGTFSEEFLEDGDGDYNTFVIDLSPLTQEGEFYISIPGVGRSYAFGQGNKYAYHLYYVHMKGLFQQRCGIELTEPYTQWTRGRCHENMYIMETDPSQDKIDVPDNLTPVPSIGGHHDAADFDQRSLHLVVPSWLLSAYEYAPERLKDGELDIPESGNGVPDIIDEALWNIKRWELLQTNEGGIRGGIETFGHPAYGFTNAVRDDNKYGTYRIHGYATLMGAGTMAYASRLIAPFNATKAEDLKQKALKAWNYYENHKNDDTFKRPEYVVGSEWTPAPLMYAGLQLYLLTGEEKYHTAFKENYTDLILDPQFGYPVAYQQYYFNGNTMYQGAALTFHFVSYILDTKRQKDQTIVDHIKETIIAKSDYFLKQLSENGSQYGHLYTSGWGMGSGVGRWGELMMWAYKLTGDQKYLDATSLCADFVLGANHRGICMTTGLGERPPYDPLTDSFDHIMEGKGPFPGVVLYYYGGISKSELDNSYPLYDDLPEYRKFIDNWVHVGQNEYTIDETMAPNIFMYVALMEQNNFSGAVLPFGDPDVFPGGYQNLKNTPVVSTWEPQVDVQNPAITGISGESSANSKKNTLVVYPNPANTEVYFKISNESGTVYDVDIFDAFGRQVEHLSLIDNSGWNSGAHSSGIYYYRVSTPNEVIRCGKIILE